MTCSSVSIEVRTGVDSRESNSGGSPPCATGELGAAAVSAGAAVGNTDDERHPGKPGSHDQIAAAKKQLRRELLTLAKALTASERLDSDARICRRIEALPQFQQAGRLFIFVGTGWEVDTWPLIEAALAAGKQVAVPRCQPLSEGGGMEACLIRSRQELRLTPPLGLWEPAAGTPVLKPEELDFALIPCVACDKSGRRLGRGGGYYDRFLTRGSFYKAAVCRSVLLQEILPHEAHDEKVDIVVTDKNMYDCTGCSRRSPADLTEVPYAGDCRTHPKSS